MTDSMEDRMIEAEERDGVDPDESYEHVRDIDAMTTDLDMPVGKMGPGNVGQVVLAKDRLWVNEARTVLVTLWSTGAMEVATRETPAHTWGPPTYLTEEKV